MPEVLAWEHLHDPAIGGQLTGEQLLEMAQRAGIPEETAQKWATQRALERMRMDLPP